MMNCEHRRFPCMFAALVAGRRTMHDVGKAPVSRFILSG
jgi:hypothetical protein